MKSGSPEFPIASRFLRFSVDKNGDIYTAYCENLLSRQFIIGLKPKNSGCSDSEWCLFVNHYGVTGAAAKAFKTWRYEMIESGYLPKSPQLNAYSMFRSVTLGRAGKLGSRKCKSDFEKFTRFINSREWTTRELGAFGKWFEGSGLPEKYLRPVLQSYLES